MFSTKSAWRTCDGRLERKLKNLRQKMVIVLPCVGFMIRLFFQIQYVCVVNNIEFPVLKHRKVLGSQLNVFTVGLVQPIV